MSFFARGLALAALACSAFPALADDAGAVVAPPTPAAPSVPVRLIERQKIDRLIELTSAADAVFVTAGRDQPAKDFADSLRARLASSGDLILSARTFIEQLAAPSTASGPATLVHAAGKPDTDARAWLMSQLMEIEHPGSAAAAQLVSPGKRLVALGTPFSITLDCTEAPELKEWGEKARDICEKQYPVLCELLNSEGFTPQSDLRIVFKGSMGPPAATGGGTISVNAPYVVQHPDDFGMMVHELTHAVQVYRRPPRGANMGWLTEGIADYTRFYKYEPGADHSRIDPDKASYRDAYRTTAAFLNYLALTHDKDIAVKLNARMRAGTCTEETFKELVGKDVGDLWKDFTATLKAKPRQ